MYIILFLHQTTTSLGASNVQSSCISSYSYIKPQLVPFLPLLVFRCISSYSYIKPQRMQAAGRLSMVVYHPIPTSNHNDRTAHLSTHFVVYHPIPTSNHNLILILFNNSRLYIILFLHQTTTCHLR